MIKLLKLIEEKEECVITLMQYELLAHSNATRACELLDDNKWLKKAVVESKKETGWTPEYLYRNALRGVEEHPNPEIFEITINRNALLATDLGTLILDQMEIVKALKGNIRALNIEIKKHIGTYTIAEDKSKAGLFKIKILSLREMYNAIKKTLLN